MSQVVESSSEKLGNDSVVSLYGAPAMPKTSEGRSLSAGTAEYVDPEVLRTRYVPTKRLLGLLALGVPSVYLLVSGGLSGAFWLVNGAIGAFTLLSAVRSPKLRGISIVRRMDSVLSVRVSNKVQITLKNGSGEPLRGVIRDEIPTTFRLGDLYESFAGSFKKGFLKRSTNELPFSVDSGRRWEHEYAVKPPERGDEQFPGTFLRLECPLGLVTKQVHLKTLQDVRVYPNVLALREFDLLNQAGRLKEVGIRQAKMRGIGTDFESLREYAEGDDFRKIDWKATARRSRLIVRQYEVERNQSVLLCIDTGRHMMAEVDGVRKLDHVLDSVLLLAHAAAAAGDHVGLLVYNNDVVKFIAPKKGGNQVGLVVEALHNLVAEPIESDPVKAFSFLQARFKKRSFLLNFTAVEDADRAREVATSMSSLRNRHLTFLVNVSDPEVAEILNRVPGSEDELYQLRAAQWATEDKKAAHSLMSSLGIRFIDSEPQDLAKALVNTYLDAKSRALI
jgi:uncharacterized protein (DUF58 family)